MDSAVRACPPPQAGEGMIVYLEMEQSFEIQSHLSLGYPASPSGFAGQGQQSIKVN